MLCRIQGWLKSAGGLGVAAACVAAVCLPLGAVYAEDENPRVKPKLEASGGVKVQVLEGQRWQRHNLPDRRRKRGRKS